MSWSRKQEYIERSIDMLLQGKRQIDISKELGVSKGYVSKLVRKIPATIRYRIKLACHDVRI